MSEKDFMLDAGLPREFMRYARASTLASQAAHLAALEAIKNLDLSAGVSLPQSQLETSATKSKKKEKLVFEINEDVIKFYEQSLIYKREKKQAEKQRLKMLAEGKVVDFVEGEQVKPMSQTSSINAPLNRPGIEREIQLSALYGSQASKIHLAETNLQLKFDKNLDRYQPIYWPSLPLKL